MYFLTASFPDDKLLPPVSSSDVDRGVAFIFSEYVHSFAKPDVALRPDLVRAFLCGIRSAVTQDKSYQQAKFLEFDVFTQVLVF